MSFRSRTARILGTKCSFAFGFGLCKENASPMVVDYIVNPIILTLTLSAIIGYEIKRKIYLPQENAQDPQQVLQVELQVEPLE